jgi:hypothetical protein
MLSAYEQKLEQEIELVRQSDETERRVESLGNVMLTRVKVPRLSTSSMVVSIASTNTRVLQAGLGWSTKARPGKVFAQSVISGVAALERVMIGDGRGLDLASIERPYRKFDLGCFSSYAPLTMVLRTAEGEEDLDMILVSYFFEPGKLPTERTMA